MWGREKSEEWRRRKMKGVVRGGGSFEIVGIIKDKGCSRYGGEDMVIVGCDY